jgi:hypothetical protein
LTESGLRTKNAAVKRALVIAALSLAACGPAEWIVETPGVSRPARPSDCAVDLIKLGPNDLAPAGPYELLGYLTIARDAVQDPTQPETREKVRSRACKMGGEALAVWDLKTSRTSPTAHTEIDYAVVRRMQGAPP